MNVEVSAASKAERPFDIDWWPNRVLFQSGAVDRLGTVLEQIGRRRAFIICGKSVAASGNFQRVKVALGNACAGIFTDIEMHSPLPMVERATQAASKTGADCIVSVGGGSAIDTGKGIALMDTVGADYRAYALAPGGKKLPPLRMAHIGIPTTTGSGSEVAPTVGLRDPDLGRKIVFRDMRLIPLVALLDPQMTVDTPVRLTAASGMTAVARCIELLYSGRRNPIHSALALHALRMLFTALPHSLNNPKDLALRSDCLIASSMSAISANANTSAVHAIGHVVGGKQGLQHGVAHAILIAETMRMMLPVVGPMQRQVLEAMGVSAAGLSDDEAGQRAADVMARFVAALPLPQRLRDVGVNQADIPAMAEHAAHDPIMIASAAGVTADKIAAILQSVW